MEEIVMLGMDAEQRSRLGIEIEDGR